LIRDAVDAVDVYVICMQSSRTELSQHPQRQFLTGCGSNYSGGGGSGGGKAIQEGEPIALAWADVYLLDPVIDKTKGAASIGGYGGLVDRP